MVSKSGVLFFAPINIRFLVESITKGALNFENSSLLHSLLTTAQSGVNARQTEPPMQIPHPWQCFLHSVATGTREKKMEISARVLTLSSRGSFVLTETAIACHAECLRTDSDHSHVIVVWAWVLWSAYALGTRTSLWFGRGCSGDHMLRPYALGTRTLLWLRQGCSGDRLL